MSKGFSELERPGKNTLTMEEFKLVLPHQVKKSMNEKLLNMINETLSSPEEMEVFRENLLSYTQVMKEGKFKLSGYINAVKYVSFKLLGDTNINAFIKTFPEKYRRFKQEGIEKKDIASYATAFNKSKLVNLIFEQTMIPTHVLNAPLYQEALNVQAELMMYAKSEKVRSDAANSLLTHLKPPESKKIELEITSKEDSSIELLRRSTMALVAQQRLMISSGLSHAGQVAASQLQIRMTDEDDENIIEVDMEEVA